MAPVVVGDHLLVGTGNDLDSPGFLQSFDPETGKLQWKFYTVPMNPGDPGLETWPNLDAARHGGGQVWIPGSYDPETKLYIFGTGNPTPGYTGVGRPGDNLFTCSLIAVNVDTGKMAWYFQTSVHDTHDWDSTQTPVLIDGVINGRQRKLVSTAERNGYFYTLDRVTGEHIVTAKYGSTTNWAMSTAAERRRGTGSAERSHDSRIAGVSRRKRRDELAASGVLAGHRTCSMSRNTMASTWSTSRIPIRAVPWGSAEIGVRSSVPPAISLPPSTTRPAASPGENPSAGGGVGPDCWRRRAACCLPATAAAISWRSMHAMENRCGTRASATCPMRRRHICSMGVSNVLVAVGDTLYAFTLY